MFPKSKQQANKWISQPGSRIEVGGFNYLSERNIRANMTSHRSKLNQLSNGDRLCHDAVFLESKRLGQACKHAHLSGFRERMHFGLRSSRNLSADILPGLALILWLCRQDTRHFLIQVNRLLIGDG